MATKFTKWNSFIRFTLDDLIEYFSARGIELDKSSTTIIGNIYNPEQQAVTILVASMLSGKKAKEFDEKWPYK
jgi:hypothetical protein